MFFTNLRNNRRSLSRLKSRAGETMVEIMISLFCLALGAGAASSLIVSALQTNSSTRDNLIALNLAREGIEAVRNIRDTNWLKWGYNKEDCWKLIKDDTCQPAAGPTPPDNVNYETIAEGYYRVGFDLGSTAANRAFKWKLQPQEAITNTDEILNLSDGVTVDDQYFNLHRLDIYPSTDSNNDAIANNDPDLYSHVEVNPPRSDDGTIGTDLGESPFYRMIYISYPSADVMEINSIVQWNHRGRVQEVELVSRISNYQNYL